MSAVAERSVTRATLAALAPLYRYPEERVDAHAEAHGEPLASFFAEMRALPLAQQQELYTRTFDLAPSCSPYLGVHLFGDDDSRRARLMMGLRRIQKRGPELPDHIAEVLAIAESFDEAEWGELVALVLGPALAVMHMSLCDSANPYRHLVAATAAITGGLS